MTWFASYVVFRFNLDYALVYDGDEKGEKDKEVWIFFYICGFVEDKK
ncbi:hypothetical protein Pf1_01070 [Flavobacterium columnare]|nr:hypothetical protein Pf1_01070 [Flavobacterium columnare]GEM57511.1 hypothetical protein FC1_07490 [Flavobacterium columnare NBRC 100251 = ATCC 23463]